MQLISNYIPNHQHSNVEILGNKLIESTAKTQINTLFY